jgi:hypothetical protein
LIHGSIRVCDLQRFLATIDSPEKLGKLASVGDGESLPSRCS